jgi:hypothetical protein
MLDSEREREGERLKMNLVLIFLLQVLHSVYITTITSLTNYSQSVY